ncbi:MAG: hypothetical protein PHN31_06765, partial [Candidatus Gracilibacteria bacterium]|nr:hypothetical protein [Candidatus Gracilibacteria bacterium]
PIYNSDVYGKESYFGATGTGNTYGSSIKIVGETYSQSYNEILSGQEGSDVKLIEGSISKVGMKTDVRKNVFNLTRGVTISNSGNLVDDFNFTNNEDGAELLNGTLLYFGNEGGANVTIQAGTVNGNKTIVVEGGNIYITGNINTTGVDSVLGLVALEDGNGLGGNIYIDPNVRYIKAVMYADKSVISYDGLNELGGNATFSDLKNQLYIYGSLFTENTVGGSRANPLKCPYYITTCTSIEDAQKYDLNYLRRYYLKDTDGDGAGDTPAGGGVSSTPFITSTSQYYQYPVVIEYNPLIQTNPPIVFK